MQVTGIPGAVLKAATTRIHHTEEPLAAGRRARMEKRKEGSEGKREEKGRKQRTLEVKKHGKSRTMREE